MCFWKCHRLFLCCPRSLSVSEDCKVLEKNCVNAQMSMSMYNLSHVKNELASGIHPFQHSWNLRRRRKRRRRSSKNGGTCGWPTNGFVHTTRKVDFDFRVPGLSHAVVKRAENFSGRELVIKIESHLHRETPQEWFAAATNTFSIIRKRLSANWAMWSNSSCAKQYQRYNFLTLFFIGIKEFCTALADNAWLTAIPEESFTN